MVSKGVSYTQLTEVKLLMERLQEAEASLEGVYASKMRIWLSTAGDAPKPIGQILYENDEGEESWTFYPTEEK